MQTPFETNVDQARASSLTNIEPVSAVADACAKFIVVGEHAVVYGATAVAAPIDKMRVTLRLVPTNQFINHVPKMDLTLGGRSVSDHVSGLLQEAFLLLKVNPKPILVDGYSTVLMGAGLGSSAALSVALLRVLTKSLSKSLSNSELAECANHLEKRFHGTPSGLDTAVVAAEESVSFNKEKGFSRIKIEPIKRDNKAFPWRFALIDSGVRAPTLAMIQIAQPYFQEDTQSKVLAFENLSQSVLKGFATGEVELVASAMQRAGELLEDAKVVTPPLKAVITKSMECGVLAAKSTGAGGGGCVVALLDPIVADVQMSSLRDSFGDQRVFDVTIR